MTQNSCAVGMRSAKLGNHLKNPRDQLAVRNLLLQAFPTYWEDVMDVYQKVINNHSGTWFWT